MTVVGSNLALTTIRLEIDLFDSVDFNTSPIVQIFKTELVVMFHFLLLCPDVDDPVLQFTFQSSQDVHIRTFCREFAV